MVDSENFDPFANDLVENPIRIGRDSDDANTKPLHDLPSGEGLFGDHLVDFPEPRFEGRADRRPMLRLVIANPTQIGERGLKNGRSSCRAKSRERGGKPFVAGEAARGGVFEPPIDRRELIVRRMMDARAARLDHAYGVIQRFLVIERPFLDDGDQFFERSFHAKNPTQ